MEELISVVVPIYNVEKYLQKCIDSILAQTYRHLEIILVDDGSPDNCGAICDNYAQEDGRVLVIHKKNGGLSSARNAGLEIAKGELIVFIDSDDWIDANYIEKLYDDISESGADVAVPAFCISFENGDCAVDSRVKEVTTYSKKEALEVFLFNGYLTPCVASKMWKKSLWQKIRCPEGKLFEDQYTTYKLLIRHTSNRTGLTGMSVNNIGIIFFYQPPNFFNRVQITHPDCPVHFNLFKRVH